MAAGTFKVTAKTQGYRRNTNKLSSPATLLGLGLAVMLVATAFLVIDPVLVHSSYFGGSDNDVGNDIAVDSAGNAYIAGRRNLVNFQPQCIAGELDTSFNPGAGVTRGVSATGFAQAVNALAVQPDAKVLAGGRFVQNDDRFPRLIDRFNSDGSRDTSFNSPRQSGIIAPLGTLPRVLALARQSDGKIVIGGDFKIDGESRNGIARLNSDGSLDTSFNPGTGVNDEILALAVQPDGQIVIGSYIYGVYKGSLGRRPTFLEFMRDMPQLVNGIIVAGAISGPAIEANRAQYVAQFVQRPEFAGIYGALSNQGYVDKLFMTTGTSVSDADKQALVNGLDGGAETRPTVLHKGVNGTRVISEGQVEIIAVYGKTFSDTEFNPSFVQMEYFGYMRRNEDTAGFNHWLGKLNFFGDFITAEMVRSFLLSPEYRRRFGST